MDTLRDQLQRIHSNVESEIDTEQLRVAMLSYRELFDSLGAARGQGGAGGAAATWRRLRCSQFIV
jgi:hypothetical protein